MKALALVFCSCVGFAQPVAFGVKVGVPLTQALFTDTARSDGGTGGSTQQSYSSSTKRYTVGGEVELRLPFHLSVELDALYKHFDYTHFTQHTGIFNDTSAQTLGTSVNQGEFPLLLKYHFARGPLKPYIGAGPSLSHIAGTNTNMTFTQVTPAPSTTVTSTTSSRPAELGRSTTGGVAAEVGLDFRVPLLHIHIAPELRYTHWVNPNFDSQYRGTSQGPATLAMKSRLNQAEFLVGFTY